MEVWSNKIGKTGFQNYGVTENNNFRFSEKYCFPSKVFDNNSDNANNKQDPSGEIPFPLKVFGDSGRVFQWSDHFMGGQHGWASPGHFMSRRAQKGDFTSSALSSLSFHLSPTKYFKRMYLF